MNESIVIVLLILLNAGQIYFWSKQVQKLVDKVMSKNYAEFVAVDNFKKPQTLDHRKESEDLAAELKEEEELLSQLNGMIRT